MAIFLLSCTVFFAGVYKPTMRKRGVKLIWRMEPEQILKGFSAATAAASRLVRCRVSYVIIACGAWLRQELACQKGKAGDALLLPGDDGQLPNLHTNATFVQSTRSFFFLSLKSTPLTTTRAGALRAHIYQ